MDISIREHILVGHYVLYPIREYLPIIFSKNQKNRGLLSALPYTGASFLTLLGLDHSSDHRKPLRSGDPGGIFVLSVVNGSDLTRCQVYSYERTSFSLIAS